MRSPDEFSGKLLAPAHLPQEQSQRPGHVPSARNIPWSKNANDDGTFKSDDELKELYADEQVDLAKDTIAYCRIGERSALTWFVLHELLGVRERQELRRLLDRVRLPRRRADRARRQQVIPVHSSTSTVRTERHVWSEGRRPRRLDDQAR